jgi:hypothetical protein
MLKVGFSDRRNHQEPIFKNLEFSDGHGNGQPQEHKAEARELFSLLGILLRK